MAPLSRAPILVYHRLPELKFCHTKLFTMPSKTLLESLRLHSLEYRDKLIIQGNPNSYEKKYLFSLINALESVADDANTMMNLKYSSQTLEN